MLRDREAKLYCAGSGWTGGGGVNPFVGAQVRSAGFSPSLNAFTTESTEDTETVRGGDVRSSRFSGSSSEERHGGSAWLDESATEALLLRAGVQRSASAGSLPILDPYMRF
jgi:hypothetical protein